MVIKNLHKLLLTLILIFFQLELTAQICITPGKDGAPTANTAQINTYYPGLGTVAIGGTSISLGASGGNTTPINKGDLVLIIQMQGADINTNNTNAYGSGTTSASGNINDANFIAGRYEYAIAANNVATSGGTLTLSAGTANAYSTTNYSNTGQRRFQVIRVPQFSSITLSAGINALPWNGTIGGVIAMDVAGRLNFNGQTINAAGAGFRGGAGRAFRGASGLIDGAYRTLSTVTANAQKGEGSAGTPANVFNAGNNTLVNTGAEGYVEGSMGRGAPGNAGGGATDGNPTANDQNSGGGGGGNGGAGGKGGNAWSSNETFGGFGGSTLGAGAPNRLLLGGGGGAGSTNDASGNIANGLASSGAPGGGIVIVRAGTITGTGSILANGGNANNSVGNDGSGGGGAGGSVLITAASGPVNTITVNAAGGTGGTNTGSGGAHGPGGGGGGGVVFASSTLAGTNIAGGTHGTTTTSGLAFGSTSGTLGVLSTTVTNSQITNVASGATCLPILAVSKTTTTPTIYKLASGTQATYEITVSNTGGAAQGVRVNDVLPANFTFNSNVSIVTGTINGAGSTNLGSYDDAGTTPTKAPILTTNTAIISPTSGATNLTWGTFYIPSGTFIRITFRVDIGSGAALNTPNQNSARASYLDPTRTSFSRLVSMDALSTDNQAYETGASAGADVPGSNYNSNSSANEDVTLLPPIDVAVTNIVSPGPYYVGKSVTYTITATNNSTGNATGLVITDVLPAGLTFVSATPNSGYNSSTGAWNIGTLAGGTTATLQLIATPNTAGNITTTANITAQNEPDEVTNNNSASNSISVATPADVAVTTVIAAGPYYNGVNTTFNITATNNGPNNASGISIQEQIPAGFDFVSATPSSGTYSNGNWAINSLANTASATLRLVLRPNTTGSLTVTSTKTAQNEYDNVPGNNSSGATINVSPNAEVAVVNTVASGPYYRGVATTYTIIVSNNGPDDASGLEVTDLLPSTLIYRSSNPASGTTYDNTTGKWVIGNLAKNTSKTLTISATPNTTNAITTTATITAQGQYDQNTANNSSSNTIYPNATADVAISNVAAAGPYYRGVNTTFTITARNNGPNNATGLSVRDVLPAGLQFVSANPSDGTYDQATGIWNVGNLAANTEATLSLVVRPTTTGTLSTTASVNGVAEYDNVTGNNSATASINVQANADLAITNVVSAAPYQVGTNVTYTVTIINNGPDAASNVTVTDQLPAGLNFVGYSATTGNGTYDNSTGVWTIGALASGQTQTLTITATPNTTAQITTLASITNSSVADSQPANNNSSNTISAGAAPVADIAITNTAAGGNYYNGVPTTFTVTAQNNGPNAATGVQVTDLLPSGLTLISAEPSLGTYDASNGVWNIGSISNGAAQRLVLTVVPNTSGTITTLAQKTAQTENDNVAGNNSDPEEITVLDNADIGVELFVTNGPFYVGDYPVFSVRIRNNGPNTATNVRLFDNRPGAFSIPTLQVTPSTGTYDRTTGNWDIPSLASGAEATITLTGQLIRSGTISLRVTKTGEDQYDSNAGNNDDFATIVILPSADIEVTNTVSAGPYFNQTEVTYTVTAKNLGPSPSSGVVITDQLPGGMEFVRATTTTGTYNSTDGTWSVGNIAVGGTQTLTIVARPIQAGTFTTIATKTDQKEMDKVSTNNTASNQITVGTSSDVAATFTVTPGPYYRGVTEVIFTGTVTNNGPDVATGVIYFDNRPSFSIFSIKGVTTDKGTYNPFTGYWNVGTLAVGETANIAVKAVPIVTGDITILATKTGQDQQDQVTGNNDASVTVNVQKAADIQLSSTQASGPYFVNQETTFTITANNNGADDATSVGVRHELPVGLAYVSYSSSSGTYNPSTGVWSIGDLPVSTPATITVTVRPATTGELTVHSAKSAATEYDQNTPNNTVNTVFNVIQNQPAVYTVIPAKNVDAYTNNFSLASATDPDGPITAASIVNGSLPAGVAFNQTTGEFTVSDRALLQPGSYILEVRTTDQNGGYTTLPVILTFLPDDEAAVILANTKDFYDYQNNESIAEFRDDNGRVIRSTLIGGTLPNGTTLFDGHVLVTNRLLIRPGSYPVSVRTEDETGGISVLNFTIVISGDRDNDGAVDPEDIDDNNDGLTDIVSGFGFDPLGDSDGDGAFNYYDTDFVHTKYGAFRDKNNDQINDWFDIDLDGIVNSLDLDMDGDGMANTREANGGMAPNNYNTTISKFGGGIGPNGMPDEAETSPESGVTNLPMPDSDRDGLPDYLDIDSDNDGILDNVEAQTTAGYRSPVTTDNDRDGLVSNYDGNENGAALIPVNTDANFTTSDTVPDYLDLNSDNDKSFDYYEAFDDNHDNQALDNLVQRAQAFEAAAGKGYYLNRDINSFQDTDAVPDWLESPVAQPNFLTYNSAFYHDSDQDGLVDLFDADNSGVVVIPSKVNNEADFRSEQNVVPLPVDLIRFEAIQKNQTVQLNWATASELNNDYFNIERSSDGKTFTQIGQVKGAGTSTQVKEYIFVDDQPLPGISYYRLKQVDYNGTSKYSKIVFTNRKAIALATANLYPNPVQEETTIEFTANTSGNYSIQVFDVRGRQVKVITVPVIQGKNKITLTLADLASGKYILNVSGLNTYFNLPFIKN